MFSNIEQAEYMDTYMSDVREWMEYEADMETHPFDE